MGWYIRKSINVGPIRFNLSKSGIGTSFGVTGFRIGIRPDGSSYLHAGRYGLYYREELGGKRKTQNTRQSYSRNEHLASHNTTYHNNISSRDLKSDYKKELVQALTKSYQSFRYDYLTAFIALLISVLWECSRNTMCFKYGWSPILFNIILTILVLLGVYFVIVIANWETYRRRIDLFYHFEDDNYEYYKKIIFAFNKIASCEQLKGVTKSEYLSDSYLSKVNAGANYLTNSTPAYAGTGKIPWVNTNITIPSINACGRSFYFMPDGLYIYDSYGIACVSYMDIEIDSDTTQFIEPVPPSDARVIDYTWQYVNKDGGPDQRFNNNYRIPICMYGVLSLKVRNKELLYLITSKEDASDDFEKSMRYFKMYVQNIKSKYSRIKRP